MLRDNTSWLRHPLAMSLSNGSLRTVRPCSRMWSSWAIRAFGGSAAIPSEVNHEIGVMGEIDSKYPFRRFQLQAKS